MAHSDKPKPVYDQRIAAWEHLVELAELKGQFDEAYREMVWRMSHRSDDLDLICFGSASRLRKLARGLNETARSLETWLGMEWEAAHADKEEAASNVHNLKAKGE